MPKKQVTAGREPHLPGTGAVHLTGLKHRSLLDHPPGFRPFRGTGLFGRIGGQPVIDRLVDLLYEGLEDDQQLRPLLPSDLAGGRAMQKIFFAEWLDGPRRYSEQSHASLGHRHGNLPITPALAGRWLNHFRRALEATVTAENDCVAIFAQARSLAQALVNPQAAPASPARRGASRRNVRGSEPGNGPQQVAWCGVAARSLAQARDLGRRGDTAGLSAALAEAPDLLLPAYAAAIMQTASLAGRTEIIELLLDRGAGPDHPFYLPVSVTGRAFEQVLYVTPLCAARLKRRSAAESLLLTAGASEDIFTSAFLGDLAALTQLLTACPDLAQAPDPAVDVLVITPVDHAVAGGQASELQLILDHVTPPFPTYVRALRSAAEQGSVPMAEQLLAHGADAARIGAGRWVLHPGLAPLLASHGASAGTSGGWIGASCTGNQGRKDDPEYVRALLRHGADVNDRRTGDPASTTGVGALRATALHYAAKAGFLQSIEVLLEHGADPEARDSQGRTPLDWLGQAAPSVPRAAARHLLGSRPR